jgi:hypothetical protein
MAGGPRCNRTSLDHHRSRRHAADIGRSPGDLFNGQPFTASSPSGVKFKMIFAADGKVTREPLAGAGAKGEGTWKLDKEGFCTTWKGQKPNCYNVITNGQNKWSIMRASSLLAVWSK